MERGQKYKLFVGKVLLATLAIYFCLQLRIIIGQEKSAISLREKKGNSVAQIFQEIDTVRKQSGCNSPVIYLTAQPQVVDGIDPTGVVHFGLTPCRFRLHREVPATMENCSVLIHASHPAFSDQSFGKKIYSSQNYKLYRCRKP